MVPGPSHLTLFWGDHPHQSAVPCSAGCPVLRAWTWATTQGCRAQWGDTGLLGGTTLSQALQTPSVTSYVPPLSKKPNATSKPPGKKKKANPNPQQSDIFTASPLKCVQQLMKGRLSNWYSSKGTLAMLWERKTDGMSHCESALLWQRTAISPRQPQTSNAEEELQSAKRELLSTLEDICYIIFSLCMHKKQCYGRNSFLQITYFANHSDSTKTEINP